MKTTSDKIVVGEYYLHSVTEVASGFKLNVDESFEFFFSYGALDRYGNGTWKQVDNQIIFNSINWIGRDFHLIESKIVDYDRIVVEISECNPNILSYIFSSLLDGKPESWKNANKEGIIYFDKQQFTSISLAFEFCPERFSKFNIENNGLNHFRFKPESWLFEYFFSNFVLESKENGLFGKHPMMDKEFLFLKNK